jgi:hypothetical protein
MLPETAATPENTTQLLYLLEPRDPSLELEAKFLLELRTPTGCSRAKRLVFLDLGLLPSD